jgi:hypothetical protein
VAAILDPLTLKPGGMLVESNRYTGERTETPTFTCCHCQRVVFMNANRVRERHTCRNCMAWTCDSGPCVVGCHPFKADLERAYKDKDGQPWLLRINGEPVTRLWGPDGESYLVLAKDVGTTWRELTRWRRKDETDGG